MGEPESKRKDHPINPLMDLDSDFAIAMLHF